MNKVPIVVIAVGIIITLAGIFVVLNIEETNFGIIIINAIKKPLYFL